MKFLFVSIKNDLRILKVDIKKFDQCKEVRNLNVPHNRDNFINLTIMEVLINNHILNENDYQIIIQSQNENLKQFLSKKIKYIFQFEFLPSNYFRSWLRDPIKILDVFKIHTRTLNLIKIVKNSLTIQKIYLNQILKII